jgi:hypothetical protein
MMNRLGAERNVRKPSLLVCDLQVRSGSARGTFAKVNSALKAL